MPAESVELSEGDNHAGGTELVLTSPHWRLRVNWGQRLDPYELVHLASGRVVADESYCYQLTVTGATNSGYHGGPAGCRRVRPLEWSIEHHEDSGATLLSSASWISALGARPASASSTRSRSPGQARSSSSSRWQIRPAVTISG